VRIIEVEIMRRLREPRKVLGVTLVELMVSLAVLAIVLIAAVPSFIDFFDKSRVRGAADGVVSLISVARAEAVKTDLDVNIAMVGSGTSWCVGANAATPPTGGSPAGAASACDCTDPADVSQCRVDGQRSAVERGAYPEVRVGSLPTDLTFDSKLGTIVPLGTRTVTFTSPRGKFDLAVEVNSLGQARLCVPPGKPSIAGVMAC
jgi:type IV fimbrial biogenesis protein FimT